MNISTNIYDEYLDDKKPSNGYEWWYFDAISTDKKWSIVLIFYQGNPFSTHYIKGKYSKKSEEYPALSISVYKNGKTEYYSFLEYPKSEFVYHQTENLNLSIGGCSITRKVVSDSVEYTLNLNQTLESGHKIHGELTFLGSKISKSLIDERSKQDLHFWNLLLPKSKVTASLKIRGKTDLYNVRFHGNGYHDHNIGHELMSESFKDWYWGRFHFTDFTVIYYIMNGYHTKQHQAWLISRDNKKVLGVFETIKLSSRKKNLLGLKSFRDIELSGQLGTLKIKNAAIIDDGPFYQRFLSNAIFIDASGTTVQTGFSEYIHPSRIENEKYWWMVRMRLRYLREKAHWVQKSKIFYEWTW